MLMQLEKEVSKRKEVRIYPELLQILMIILWKIIFFER